ncbi:MAG: Lrp/AsnC family transcriptional regulator [Alphaproteobacteria bacterium]
MAEPKLDAADRRILRALQEDAGLSNVDLARRVGLSPSPCLRRVKALEEAGVIKGRTAVVDPAKVGLPVSVFLQVTLERQIEANLERFDAALARWPEVVEGYLMTGDADYLLRVVVPDLDAYHRFLMDKLTRVDGVASIRSSFALKPVKYGAGLPIGEA